MAKPSVKCAFCKAEIKDRENAYKHVSEKSHIRYYCSEDHFNLQQEKRILANQPKPKKIAEPKPAKEVDPTYVELTDWIQNYYLSLGWNKTDINWMLLTAQIRNMKRDYEYKYSGILLTLQYMTEFKDKNILNTETESIVSLVPYEYENAKKHWFKKQNIREQLKDCDYCENNENIVEVSIKNKKSKRYQINTDF